MTFLPSEAVVFPPQDYVVTKRLASVFSHCYSCSPVPPVAPVDVTLSTQLGDSSLQSCDKLSMELWVNTKGDVCVSVLRYPLPEQPGDVRRDVYGGRASVLRSPRAADVGFRTVGFLFSDLLNHSFCFLSC